MKRELNQAMGGRSGGGALPVARLRGPGAGFLLAAVRRVRPLARSRHPDAVCDDGPPVQRSEGRRYGGGGQAFCVRTCDGRHFPLTASDNQSRAQSCSSLCPASETKVVYGSSIDDAATDNGKPYSELPNAFRYRNELVSGCTCNGKDQLGLAQVKIEDDPTLRKGDIVAGENGLLVAGRPDQRGAELKF